jgi:hypothetical protein
LERALFTGIHPHNCVTVSRNAEADKRAHDALEVLAPSRFGVNLQASAVVAVRARAAAAHQLGQGSWHPLVCVATDTRLRKDWR